MLRRGATRLTALLAATLVLIAIVTLAAPVPSSYAGSEPEKPRYGGIYVRNNIYSDPPSMDPAFTVGAAANMIQMNIFDGLVKLDPGQVSNFL